jgi:5'-nucleotidase
MFRPAVCLITLAGLASFAHAQRLAATPRTLTNPVQLEPEPATPVAPAIRIINPGQGLSRIDFWLTVLHANDGESKVLPLTGAQAGFAGAARFKSLADRLKFEARQGEGRRGVLMISSGDNFLAGAAFNASLANGVPFFDSRALDLAGFDAIAPGNHDFDFGPDVFADFANGFANTPFVSANIDATNEPNVQALVLNGQLRRSAIVTTNGERFGVIGLITPILRSISSPRNLAIGTNLTQVVQDEVNALESQGINRIILTSHLQNLSEEFNLAATVRGVDIIIGGGGSELVANPSAPLVPGDTRTTADLGGTGYPRLATDNAGATVPVVTTSGEYKYIGRLMLGWSGGTVRAIDNRSDAVRVAPETQPDGVTPDPTVVAQVEQPVQSYVNALAAIVVGNSSVPLDGRRGNGNANPASATPGIRTTETNLGNLSADSLLWTAQQKAAEFGVPVADIAIQNGGGIRNNNIIPTGNISELDTFNIHAFANFVSVVPNVTPTKLKELLENAYSRVEFADGRFAQISGMTVVYDQDRQAQIVNAAGGITTPGDRIREVVLSNGTVIVTGGAISPTAPASLTLATIDFLVRANGDQYPFNGMPFTTVGVTYQQALRDYISTGLSGLITPAQYPAGGEGRITRLN